MLFTTPFPGERLLEAPFLTRLHVEGVSLNFFDDVLLLNFSFEATKGAVQGLAFVDIDFSHSMHLPRWMVPFVFP